MKVNLNQCFSFPVGAYRILSFVIFSTAVGSLLSTLVIYFFVGRPAKVKTATTLASATLPRRHIENERDAFLLKNAHRYMKSTYLTAAITMKITVIEDG